MKSRRDRCVLILSRTMPISPLKWDVVAVFENNDYLKAETQYNSLNGDKILLVWRLEDGIFLSRVETEHVKFKDSVDSLILPFHALPPVYRSGMHDAIYNAVINFTKEK